MKIIIFYFDLVLFYVYFVFECLFEVLQGFSYEIEY